MPPIDEDQKVALLHATFKGTTLFRGELAKLQKAPPPTCAPKSYTRHGRSLRRGGYSQKRGGRNRDHDRSSPSTTITKLPKSGDGQTTMTVTVPENSNKQKVQSHEEAPRS